MSHFEDNVKNYYLAKNISKSIINMDEQILYLRTYEPDMNYFMLTKVIAKQLITFDNYFRVTTESNSVYILSADHMLFTLTGWKSISNINIGEKVLNKNSSFTKIIKKVIVNESKQLLSIKTDVGTYIYGGLFHHN